MKLSKEDYVLKITNASPAELIVISYELTISSIQSAAEAGAQAEKKRHIGKAKAFLSEIIAALDLNHQIARELMKIYFFVNKTLIDAVISTDTDHQNKLLKSAADILNTLLPGWKNAAEQESGESGAVQNNTPRVFAGLTYNKNGEMEEFTEGSNREYQA